MTYLSILRSPPADLEAADQSASGHRASLYVLVAAAAVAGIAIGNAYASEGDVRAMESSLIMLLRFMAVLKAAMALAMLALVHWRLSRPASSTLSLGYAGAVALAAAAPGLIWSLSFVALGAALFHAGLIMFLLLAWRDETVELKILACK